MISLNSASAAFSMLTLALASWCALRLRWAHSDWRRCRTISLLSAASFCYAACQLLLAGHPRSAASQAVVKVCLFCATFSAVLSGFLIASAVGADAAVRFGLRSFGLAQRLGSYWDAGSVICALLVSQSALYVFGDLTWTGSAVAVANGGVPYAAAVWIAESAWIALSLVAAVAFAGYAALKANKATRFAGSCADGLQQSALGTAASIRGRIAVSLCYVVVLAVSRVWKLAFYAGGSNSAWLFSAASIGEAVLPMLVLPVFSADIGLNMRRAGTSGWLSASFSSLESTAGTLQPRRARSQSFTGWRKTEFIEWQKLCSNLSATSAPTDSDAQTWVAEIKPCHVRPE
ncbi:hypothetical protein H4R19_007081, partial [Coemansia spiralis]